MRHQGSPGAIGERDPRSGAFVEDFSAILVSRGLLDTFAVRRAQRAQSQSGERFDLVLTRLGLLTESQLAHVLCEHLGLVAASAADFPEAALFPEQLSIAFLKSSRMLPIQDHAQEQGEAQEQGDAVVVAIADPFNTEALSALSFLLKRPIECRLATAGDIDHAIDRLYGPKHAPASRADIATRSAADDGTDDDVRRLEDLASEAPVIKLVQELVVRAVEQQASDIHIEPREDCVRVRYRIDGVLHTVETLPLSVRLAMSSRIKVMAQLNIAERRLPQDGRIKVVVRGRDIDLRVSTMPTMCGESVVLRILDRSSVALDFSRLGFEGAGLAHFKQLLAEPNGIILVTGPTGSGKTTTLYTALGALNDSGRKLFTVEDPIEYQLTGVNQIQVNARIGLSFASALRSMLRQDPDIIMIGEIRDLETAEIAIRASLTGHLVLSTVHTNSAAATITRLLDMGVEDYLLGSSLKGVLAQRLVRRLCASCAAPAEISQPLRVRLAELGAPPEAIAAQRIKHAVGCTVCRNTGFAGRTVIYELLSLTDAVRDTVLRRGSERALEDAAISAGMTTMLSNGLSKVLAGETTLEEVFRVTKAGDATL